MIFKGIITALITPINEMGDIDYEILKKLIDRQIDAKIDGLIIAGSTGEGSSLDNDQYYELIKASVEYSNGRIPIIAGLAGVSTKSVCHDVRILCEIKIDGIMCTVPHYVRPEQEGLYLHFKAINDASSRPIMIYLNPGRTGVDMTNEVILKLALLENIVAVKDCSNDYQKPLKILPNIDSDFVLLSGDDNRFLDYTAYGGVGLVSVVANIFPKICKKIYNLQLAKNIDEAKSLYEKLLPVITAISFESNPIGIKCASSELGLCAKYLILPLTCARKSTRDKIIDALPDLVSLEKNV